MPGPVPMPNLSPRSRKNHRHTVTVTDIYQNDSNPVPDPDPGSHHTQLQSFGNAPWHSGNHDLVHVLAERVVLAQDEQEHLHGGRAADTTDLMISMTGWDTRAQDS